MKDALMLVEGPFGGRTYEVCELAGENYQTLTLLNEAQAESLLRALANRLGYTVTKKG
jgi:hypothetical protein